MSTPSSQPDLSAREIVSSRAIAVSRAALYAAFANPERLARWWGPNGFTNTFDEFDLTVGGHWRFTMHGPDGKNYANHSQFLEIEPDRRVRFEHTPAPHFFMTISFDDDAAGSRITFRMLFDTPEMRDAVLKYAGSANEENFDRLEAELQRTA